MYPQVSYRVTFALNLVFAPQISGNRNSAIFCKQQQLIFVSVLVEINSATWLLSQLL